MAIALRLSRSGAKKRPYYRIVAADSRSPRDGKYLEQIGTYNPLLAKDDPARVKLNEERARYWVGVGAQPSDRVLRFLDAAGIVERAPRNNPKKAEPGEKAKERAEERAAKAAEAEEAANAPAEAASTDAPAEGAVDVEATPGETVEASSDEPVEGSVEVVEQTEEAASEESPATEVSAEEAPVEGASEDEAGEEKAEG